jgi:hypothetical protein
VCASSLDHITPKTLALHGVLTFSHHITSELPLTDAFRDLTDLLKNSCFADAKPSGLDALDASPEGFTQTCHLASDLATCHCLCP